MDSSDGIFKISIHFIVLLLIPLVKSFCCKINRARLKFNVFNKISPLSHVLHYYHFSGNS